MITEAFSPLTIQNYVSFDQTSKNRNGGGVDNRSSLTRVGKRTKNSNMR